MHRTLRATATVALSALGLLLAACGGSGGGDANAENAKTATPAAGQSDTGSVATQEMALGSPDAKVTIVEYASVTCPHCAHFHETVFPELKKNYIDTGKVRFVFREFPTPPATLAVAGFMVARCAAQKNGAPAYFAMLDTMFNTQQTWVLGDNPREELLKIAAQAGMDETAFEDCIKRKDILEEINKTVTRGQNEFGITGTPSFLIDGTKRRIITYDDFKAAIDNELSDAAPAETTNDTATDNAAPANEKPAPETPDQP